MAAASFGSDVSSNVELSFSCTNLKDLDRFSKSDPMVYFYEKKHNEWVKIGRTEMIEDNLNPKASTCYHRPSTGSMIPQCMLLNSFL